MFMHCLCLFVDVIKHRSYLWFCVGSHSSLYMKSLVPFRSFAWWHMCRLYSNLMDLRTPNPNPHLSLKDTFSVFFFACLITCFLWFLFIHMFSLFANMLVYFHCPFLLLLCMFAGFVFCLFIARMHEAWAHLLNASKRAKISRLGGEALLRGPFFPKTFL